MIWVSVWCSFRVEILGKLGIYVVRIIHGNIHRGFKQRRKNVYLIHVEQLKVALFLNLKTKQKPTNKTFHKNMTVH